MEISDTIRKKLDESLIALIESAGPDLGKAGQRVVLVNVKNVGASFELRLKLYYDVYSGAH